MTASRPYPPDFVSRETLAYRLDLAPAAVDQYVKRGLLPAPIQIGEALRWRWSDVEARYGAAKGVTADAPAATVDPYTAGVTHAAEEAAAARRSRPQ